MGQFCVGEVSKYQSYKLCQYRNEHSSQLTDAATQSQMNILSRQGTYSSETYQIVKLECELPNSSRY